VQRARRKAEQASRSRRVDVDADPVRDDTGHDRRASATVPASADTVAFGPPPRVRVDQSAFVSTITVRARPTAERIAACSNSERASLVRGEIKQQPSMPVDRPACVHDACDREVDDSGLRGRRQKRRERRRSSVIPGAVLIPAIGSFR